MSNRTPKTIGPWGFLSAVLAFSALAFFVPFGSWRDAKIMTSAATVSTTVSMAGTSVLKHISLCDADQQHVTAILGDRLKMPVTDLSYGGQTLTEQAAYLGTAMHNVHSRVLLASASFADFTRTSQPALRRRLLFSLVSPPYVMSSADNGNSVSEIILGHDLPLTFDYRGEHFASYDDIKTRYLAVERAHATCPESTGFNMRFVQAIYYGTYMTAPADQGAIDLIGRTAKEARLRNKQFFMVIQPVDFELIGRLDPTWPELLKQRIAQLVAKLQSSGVEVIDISDAVPDAAFADRWCACGHLQSAGRVIMAGRIADELHKRAVSPAAVELN